MQHVRLIFSTVLLTVLVWASAEQLLTESTDIPVHVKVRAAPASDLVATLAEGAPTTIRVGVVGRQADVAKLKDRGTLDVTLTLSEEHVAGGQGRSLVPVLPLLRAQSHTFGACAVQSVKPESIAVDMDRRIAVALPVQPRAGRLDYAVRPQVDPASVDVTLLASTFDRIRDAAPRVVLDAEAYLRHQPEAEPFEQQVPLPLLVEHGAGEPVRALRLSPETVTLRATLRRRLKSGMVTAVPIRFVMSRSVMNRYDIEFRDPNPVETLSIRLVGPPEEVDRLVSGDRKVFAHVVLSAPDPLSEGGFQFNTPQFNLPPGVELAEDAVIPDFEIRLVPRATAAGGAGGGM